MIVDDVALVSDILTTMGREAGPCDPVSTTLRRAVDAMATLICGIDSTVDPGADLTDTQGHQVAVTALETVLRIARLRVKNVPFQLVSGDTLRAYTDASVLLSALDLLTGRGALDAIKRLDMAIIVAGAIGPRRSEWAQALITALQQSLRANDGKEGGVYHMEDGEDIERAPPRKRHKSLSPVTAMLSNFAASSIPSIPPPADYIARSATPFILRGYLSNGKLHPRWAALDRWGEAGYLLDTVGAGRVVPVEIGTSYDAESWGQRILPFETFLSASGWDIECDEKLNAPLYLAQHSLFTQFPSLERDIAIPDYVWSEPPAPPDMPAYVAPHDVLTNVWIGPGKSVVSPAHTDPYFNCYAQVLGSKRVWVAPPAAGTHMYAYGGEEKSENGNTSEAPEHDKENNNDTDDHENNAEQTGQATLASEYMTNTSTVPILRDIDDLESVRERFPDFFQHVYPAAMEAVLHAGDMLVMPPGWWHAMRGEGEGKCWSVSFWY